MQKKDSGAARCNLWAMIAGLPEKKHRAENA